MRRGDEILLCPACAQKLVVVARPEDQPTETPQRDEADRQRQRRIYGGLHRVIGRRFGGFRLVECDDGAVHVCAATADLSQRIEAHLVAVGVVLSRPNQLPLEVRSEDGLQPPARPTLVAIGQEV